MSKSVQVLFGEIVAATQSVVMADIISNIEATTGEETATSTINYQYGHEKEIKERIVSWSKDPDKRFINFPLIWLREDLKFGKNGDFQTVTIPSIVIAYGTQAKYSSSQREVYSFNTVLRPLYRELLRQIYRKCEFRIYDPLELYQAQMIEHKFWGTPEDEQAKNVFSNHVDAIEIVGLELTLQENSETLLN